jgi:hypothetical protein
MKNQMYLPYILGFGFFGILGVSYLIYAAFTPKDGFHENGKFDDDTEGSNPNGTKVFQSEVTYKQSKITMKNFDISEFDSPDSKGSGVNMKISTLKMVDTARDYAGIPFRVNSGYRTDSHNKKVGGVSDSSHKLGNAVDIHAPTRAIQKKIIDACFKAGFRRFGIYGTFVHVDNDATKTNSTCWVKSGGDASLNPLKNQA